MDGLLQFVAACITSMLIPAAKPLSFAKPSSPICAAQYHAHLLTPECHLVHLPDEVIDVLLPIPQITTLNEMFELPLPKPTRRITELKRPQKVARLLKVRPDRVDLMNQVLHAHDTVLAEMLLDDSVVGERNTLLLARLGVSALVDELTHGLEVRVAVGDEGLDNLEHLRCGLGQTDEDAVVDLEQTEELESLALLGVDLVDTLDADDEDEARLGGDVVGAFLFGDAREADLLALGIAVLFDVGLGALEDLLALLLTLLLSMSALCSTIL